ncbi:MAG: PEGA domain-containing protein [Myxococcales bacterium]|nr:PEGA domain-containing protein [Myxococcales bacterium]
MPRSSASTVPPPPRRRTQAEAEVARPVPADSTVETEAVTTLHASEQDASFDDALTRQVPALFEGGERTNVIPDAFEPDPHSAPTRSAPLEAAEDEAGFEDFEDFDEDSEPTGQARLSDVLQNAAAPDIDAFQTLPEPLRAEAVGQHEPVANLHMDWDDEDEDVETQIRDELSPHAATPPPPSALGAPSPFASSAPPPALGHSYPGNPSPFASSAPPPPRLSSPAAAHAALAPAPIPRELLAQVPPPAAGSASGLQPVNRPLPLPPSAHSASRPLGAPLPPPTAQTSLPPVTHTLPPTPEELGRPRPMRGILWGVLAAAAAAVLGLVYGGSSMFASDDPASATLVTVPADAEVLIDGRALSEQSSPFTLQGLLPGQTHELEVRKEGFASQTSYFTVGAGEVKALPNVSLEAMAQDTGFALDSQPSGAAIFIDGQPTGKSTPARLTNLDPGLHTIRLERGDSYQPWQTQVALGKGQVIELPSAMLAEAAPAAKDSNDARLAEATPEPQVSESRSSRTSSSERRARRERRASRSESVSSKRTASSEPAAGGGSMGTLRVNSRPWAQVFVDGRLIGNTPQLNIPLPAGRHKLKLVNNEMGMSKSYSVKIRPGRPTTKIVNMLE